MAALTAAAYGIYRYEQQKKGIDCRIWKNLIKLVISSGSNPQMHSVLLDSTEDVSMELSVPKQSRSMACHT